MIQDPIVIARIVANSVSIELGADLFEERDLNLFLKSEESATVFEEESKFTIRATIAALIIQACSLGLQCYQTISEQQTASVSIQVLADQIKSDPNLEMVDSISTEHQELIVELAAKEILNQCTKE